MITLHLFTCNFLPESLAKILGNFLAQPKKPVLAKFHLSCETHKSMCLTPQGGRASRPLVGLYRWCTTSVSYLLAVGGSILVKLDRFMDPFGCVLRDTPDALSRLRKQQAMQFLRVSIIHFASLYTTIRWTDVSHAFRFWQQWYVLNVSGSDISGEERAFMGMLYHHVPMEEFDSLKAHFPFFSLHHSPDSTAGERLLNDVFFHTVFETPGSGISLQWIGFPVGTNCAPTWTNLVLRFYERMHNVVGMMLFCFIDDGLVLHHPQEDEKAFLVKLQAPYLAHLRVGMECFYRQCSIPFMDLLIVRLQPLKTSVDFEPTHTCSYIPWNSNTPRHVKQGWIVAECIRFLRICSHE